MIRIAICDDDETFVSETAALLERLYGSECHTIKLCSSEELKKLLAAPAAPDVLLLDIVLDGEDGIELLKQYQSPDSVMQVIYVTSHMKYCTDVYDTRHSSFLTKPLTRAALKKAVDRALAQVGNTVCVKLKTTSETLSRVIDLSQIQYVESDAHYLFVVTASERYRIRQKLSVFLSKLDGAFMQCHQSYIVHFRRVRRMTDSGFIMENGDKVPVSRSKRRLIKEKFLEYVEGC